MNKLAEFKKNFGSKFGIVKLGIFGSVARKENTYSSDIDIVVEVKQPTLQIMHEQRSALNGLFDCKVDLIRFRDSLKPLLKANFLKDVIYG